MGARPAGLQPILLGLCAVLLLALRCGPAVGANFVPTSAWTVRPQAGPDGKSACTATTTYVSFPAEALEESAALSIRPDGSAALRLSTVAQSLDPHWLSQKTYTAHPVAETKRAWFDHGTAFPVKVTNNGLAYLQIDFTEARGLLDALAISRTLTLETEPASTGLGEYGQRVSAPNQVFVFRLDDMARLVGDFRACQQALQAKQPFDANAGPAATMNDASGQASYVPLIKARTDDVLAADRTAPESVALMGALLRLGNAQADAFQLGVARDSYRKGLSLAARLGQAGPEQEAARARLIAADLGLERLDEAEALARPTPDPRPWLAAVTVMRGDHEDGLKQFLKLLGERAGRSFESLRDFKRWSQQRELLMPDPRFPPIRGLLLLWASAALGQEDWISYDAFHGFYGELNGPNGSGSLIPAALVAETLFGCLDPAMIRDDAQVPSATRVMLGVAAFIRGESLRQAGDLGAVSSDFAYAATELAGVQQGQAWAGWVRTARLSLKSDLGLDDETTPDEARKTLEAVEQELGQPSWVWMETALVVAELELRHGDAAKAEETALRAGDVAAAALSPAHSLTRKLRLQAARARLARQDLPGAGRMAAQALGFPTLPVVAPDQLEHVSRDPAVTSDPHRGLQALAKLLGTVAPDRVDGPAVQRIQARRAERLIVQVLRGQPSSDDSTALQAVLDFARASDSALRDDDSHVDHMGRHLNQPPETLAGLLQGLEFRQPSSPLTLSMSDVNTTIRRDAAQFMRPDLVVPADYRPTLRYGAETTALESLFSGLHRRFETAGASERDRNAVFTTAIRVAAAATRGDASATIAAQFYTGAPGVMGNQLGKAELARQAVSTALFTRRLRSALWQETAIPERGGMRRRLYIRALESAASASAKMTEAFSGDSAFSYINATENGMADVDAQAYARNLGPHQAVVVWLPLETTTEVFMIGPHGAAWHELAEGRGALARRVAAIRRSLELAASQVGGAGHPTLADFPAEEARALYWILFGPLEAELRDVTHIFCAQLGVVGGLPLQLLRMDTAGAGAAAWLGDRFAVTRMPGLLNPFVLYGRPQRGGAPVRRLLAVGAPAISAASPTDARSSVAAAVLDLPPLPNAADEMRRAARALGAERNGSTILQNSDATREAVMQRLGASAYDVVMFATHGLVGGEDARIGEPALVLASPVIPAWFDDGLLHASDVAALRASADLVILSACSTASLGQDGGEPLAGLASAFMTAGGRSVVASYWVLADETAGELTSALVRGRYADHLDVAEALQRAMTALRSSGGADHGYEHPAYWAPFVVIGLPWTERSHGEAAPLRPAVATPALPSVGRSATPATVPLDEQASRLIAEGMDAESRGNCQLGSAKIRALGQLLHDSNRPAQQRQQIMNAAMALVLKDQHCQIVNDARHRQ